MTVLDTNVLSALMRPNPERTVVKWLDRQPWNSVWITSVTLLEIRFGLQTLPAGKRRTELIRNFESLLLEILDQRIAAFDAAAAEQAADIMAARRKTGQTGDLRDTMIAGIVLSRGATLATRNVRHFSDLPLNMVNPWER